MHVKINKLESFGNIYVGNSHSLPLVYIIHHDQLQQKAPLIQVRNNLVCMCNVVFTFIFWNQLTFCKHKTKQKKTNVYNYIQFTSAH